jgi:thymidylate kinase
MQELIASQLDRFVAEFFSEMHAAGMKFALLRPIISDADNPYPSDIDLFMPEEDRQLLRRTVLAYCRERHFRVCIERHDIHNTVTIHHPEARRDLAFDFAIKYLVKDEQGKAYQYYIWEDLEQFIDHSMPIPEFDPDTGFFLYLAHISSRPDKLESSPQRVMRRFALFEKRLSPEAQAYYARAMICIEPSFRQLWLNSLALSQLHIRAVPRLYTFPEPSYPGALVAIVGPDGSGKTSIRDNLLDRVPGWTGTKSRVFFMMTRTYKILFFLLGRFFKDHNPFDELFSLPFFFIAMREFEKKWTWMQNKYHISDRYFYDQLLKGIYTNGRPRRANWWEWAAKQIPTPDLIVVCEVPFEVAYARKGELRPEVWNVMYDTYFKASELDGTKRIAVCYTDGDLEGTVEFIASCLPVVGSEA